MSEKGWRERIEPGIHRAHRLACPASSDHRPGRRCGCPFEVRCPDGMGASRTITLKDHTLAQARAARRHLIVSPPPPPAPSEPVVAEPDTLTAFVTHYFQAKAPVLAANTIRNREDDYRRRIAPTLGHLPLASINRETIEVWLAKLVAGGASHRMVKQTVATLRAILATAIEWGRIAENPARRLRVPAPPPGRRAVERVLSHEQVDALIGGAGNLRTATMLRVAVEAGLRRGELAGLRWGDLDLAARRLHVARQVVQERLPGGGHEKKVGPTKGRRARAVALSGPACAALAAWFEEAVVTGGADAAGYVWPGQRGEPMHDRSAHRALERACHRAGLVDAHGREAVSLHGLRHTSGSLMLAGGVPLTVVSAQLGHANSGITASIYAHLVSERDLDLAAAVFERPQRRASPVGLVEELVEEHVSQD